MTLLDRFLSLVTWWNGGTLTTKILTRRRGVLVGEDSAGNTYYTDREGKKRWVMYNGEVEASRVGPEWHGWLHYTFDEPPTEHPMERKSWEKPHLPNLTGTPGAYAPIGSIRRAAPEPKSDYEAWTP